MQTTVAVLHGAIALRWQPNVSTDLIDQLTVQTLRLLTRITNDHPTLDYITQPATMKNNWTFLRWMQQIGSLFIRLKIF